MDERSVARFWSRVDKTDTCWLWIGKIGPDGRGRFGLKSERRVITPARAAWEIVHGDLPKGQRIYQTCRDANCVRPEHLTLTAPAIPLADRYWNMVIVNDDGCWGWNGSTTGFGYGQISLGREQKPARAHRVSWEIHYGPILGGLHVLHRCDNPPCSRPDHLFLGTDADNKADMVSKDRFSSSITRADAREIRRRYALGGVTMRQLAMEYKISPTNVGSIVHGRIWKEAA